MYYNSNIIQVSFKAHLVKILLSSKCTCCFGIDPVLNYWVSEFEIQQLCTDFTSSKCHIFVKQVVLNMSNHAVNVPYRCLVTFRFWHAKEYENTRAASRWVPTGETLHLFVVTHSFPFLHSVFCQVSSHIQVLAKRKSHEIQTKLKVHMLTDGTTLGSRFGLPESRLILWIAKDVFARAFGIFSLPCRHST